MTSRERKPRVLHVITALSIGGAQTFLLDLLPELSGEFEIRVLCLYPGLLRGEMEARGIPVTELAHRRLFSPGTLLAVMREMRAFAPDIVHTSLGRADVYGRTAARLLGIRGVFTHSQNIDDWKKLPLFNAIDNLTMRRMRAIFAVSNKVRDFLLERGVPEHKIVLCYNGARLEEKLRLPESYTREAFLAGFGFPPESRVLTIIARLDEQKGHRYLIPAFEKFAAARPRWRLLVVGGEGRINAEIESLARATTVADRIVFAGNRRDIPQILAATDIFTLPSLWEGLPLTLIEAMAWEKPVIATPVGGVPEAVVHGESAFLIEPGRPEEIVRALEWMVANPEAAQAMGRRARQIAFEKFHIRTAAQIVREQYLAALDEEARRILKE